MSDLDCEHAHMCTDNVVTYCEDCDEQWTAVTLADWPPGLATLHFGSVPEMPCVSCGARYRKHPQGFYCGNCDMVEP